AAAARARGRQRFARDRSRPRGETGRGRIVKSRGILVAAVAALLLFAAAPLPAAPPQEIKLSADGRGPLPAALQIVIVLTLLSFIPAVLVIMTSFTRIVIVFHFLRQALGTQEVPSNMVLIGLTLFLTMFVMAPVADRINEQAVQPAIAGKVSV